MRLGERISKWRQDQGRSQTWLAIEVGVSLRTMQNWEASEGEPRFTQFCAIVKALRVSQAKQREAIKAAYPQHLKREEQSAGTK